MTTKTSLTPPFPPGSSAATAALLAEAAAAAAAARDAAREAARATRKAESKRDALSEQKKELQAEIRSVRNALRGAEKELKAAKSGSRKGPPAKVKQLKARLEALEQKLEKTEQALGEARQALTARKREEKQAEQTHTETAARAWMLYDEAGAIGAVGPSFQVGQPALLKKVLRRQTRDADLKTLEIRTPGREIDPLAAKALESFETPNAEAKKEVQKIVLRYGLGTEILAVTRRLNQRSMSEPRRRVLAASYALSLHRLLSRTAEGGVLVESGSSTGQGMYLVPSIEQEVADAKSFSDAVILDQERMPEDSEAGADSAGPLYLFARELTDLVIAEARIDVDPVLRELLVRKVRANL